MYQGKRIQIYPAYRVKSFVIVFYHSNSLSFLLQTYRPPRFRNIFSSKPAKLSAGWTPMSRMLADGFFSPPVLSKNLLNVA